MIAYASDTLTCVPNSTLECPNYVGAKTIKAENDQRVRRHLWARSSQLLRTDFGLYDRRWQKSVKPVRVPARFTLYRQRLWPEKSIAVDECCGTSYT